MTPIEEMMEALDTLVKQGKVRYPACSNFSGWHIMKALMAAERHNWQRFVCQQIHYTIEARDAEYELLPIALDQGVGVQVWSPIAGGLLSGKFGRNEQARGNFAPHVGLERAADPRRGAALPHHRCAGASWATAHGVSAAQVALAWLAGRPGVANIIVGARTEAQLKDNLAAASLVLTADETQAAG